MKIALLCSGLGNVRRGHEVFAHDLSSLLRESLALTVFKGGGESSDCERVIDNVPRESPLLDHMHLAVAPKWFNAAKEQERIRVECETFAHSVLGPLLEGDFDIVHCLEQEVCEILYGYRHLFRRTPKFLFSNGGAIPARRLPRCDFVQEYTPYNLGRSARGKAFMIPHGVDVERFRPGIDSNFRARYGIPDDALLVLSVGTICYWHKRMDYVIREVAPLEHVHLAIVGQENGDSPSIKQLGKSLMGDRIVFATLPHDELPQAYAASDVFVLGSLFETFGIAFIEAMATGLPVICTNHVNQRSIVKEGIFIEMRQPGALTSALRHLDLGTLERIGARARQIAVEHYDLKTLKQAYLDRYQSIASAPVELPDYSFRMKVASNLRNAVKPLLESLGGRRI